MITVADRLRRSVPVLLIAAAGLGFALVPLAQGRLFFYWDNARMHYAQTALLHGALQHGNFPLWSPAIGLGFPVVGEGQSAHFHPVRLLTAWLFTPAAAYMWEAGLYLAIAGLGTYLFLRDLRLGRVPSLLGGVAQMFGGPSVIFIRNLAMHRSLCVLPLAMFFVERWVQTGRLGWGVGFSAVLAFQLVSGHPSIAIVTLVGASLYLFARHVQRAWRRRESPTTTGMRLVRIAVVWVLLIGLGAGLAAVQVVPTMLHAEQSHRQGGLTYQYAAESLSARIWDLPQAIIPYGYHQGDWLDAATSTLNFVPFSNVYVGILPLLLAWCAIVYIGRSRWPTLPLAIAAIVTLILALGNKTPLYLAFWTLPGMSGTRYPSRFLFFASFGLACLAAIGLHGLSRLARQSRLLPRLSTVAAPILLAALLAAGLLYERPSYRIGIAISLAMWLGAAAVVIGYARRRGARRALLAVMPVIVVTDLLVFRAVGNYATTVPHEQATTPSAVATMMARDAGTYRTLTLLPHENALVGNEDIRTLVQANHASVWGIDSFDTRGSLVPLRYYIVREGLVWELTNRPSAAALARVLGAWNVRYITSDASVALDGWPKVYESERVRVWRNPHSGPRVYLVGAVRPEHLVFDPALEPQANARLSGYRDVVADWTSRRTEAQIVDHLLRDDVDYTTTAVVDVESAALPVTDETQPKYSVEDLTPPGETDRMAFRVRTDRRALMVIANSFAPGWRASVDGRDVEILRTNWLVQGVPLDPGEHQVELSYRAPGLVAGSVVSGLSLVVLCGLVFWSRARPRAGVAIQ